MRGPRQGGKKDQRTGAREPQSGIRCAGLSGCLLAPRVELSRHLTPRATWGFLVESRCRSFLEVFLALGIPQDG